MSKLTIDNVPMIKTYQQVLDDLFIGASGADHMPMTETSGIIADNARYAQCGTGLRRYNHEQDD